MRILFIRQNNVGITVLLKNAKKLNFFTKTKKISSKFSQNPGLSPHNYVRAFCFRISCRLNLFISKSNVGLTVLLINPKTEISDVSPKLKIACIILFISKNKVEITVLLKNN